MEACLVAIPSSEALVDFAFYKAGQIALLLKDKSRVSHGGSTSCRLVIFALQDLTFMQLDRYSNGTNQLSQHIFEVKQHMLQLRVTASEPDLLAHACCAGMHASLFASAVSNGFGCSCSSF